MKYVLAVKQAAYGSQGAYSAYQFAVALLRAGHQITQIFFLQEGVSNGNGLIYPANDEVNLVKLWQQLAQQHQVPLHLCVAASQRRGIVDKLTALNAKQSNLADCFTIAGLGEFSKATLEADRLITL